MVLCVCVCVCVFSPENVWSKHHRLEQLKDKSKVRGDFWHNFC